MSGLPRQPVPRLIHLLILKAIHRRVSLCRHKLLILEKLDSVLLLFLDEVVAGELLRWHVYFGLLGYQFK